MKLFPLLTCAKLFAFHRSHGTLFYQLQSSVFCHCTHYYGPQCVRHTARRCSLQMHFSNNQPINPLTFIGHRYPVGLNDNFQTGLGSTQFAIGDYTNYTTAIRLMKAESWKKMEPCTTLLWHVFALQLPFVLLFRNLFIHIFVFLHLHFLAFQSNNLHVNSSLHLLPRLSSFSIPVRYRTSLLACSVSRKFTHFWGYM